MQRRVQSSRLFISCQNVACPIHHHAEGQEDGEEMRLGRFYFWQPRHAKPRRTPLPETPEAVSKSSHAKDTQTIFQSPSLYKMLHLSIKMQLGLLPASAS